MATSVTNPGETLRVQKGCFDFDTFDSVTVVKDVPFTSVTSVDQAVARLNGNAEKLISVINDGLKAEARREARQTSDGWLVKNDDGSVGGEFQGSPVDEKIVNGAVLNFAKSIFGPVYAKDKSAAKDKAREMIKSNPAILEGLKASAALSESEE